MAAITRKRIASAIDSVKRESSGDVAVKLGHLRRIRAELANADNALVVEFVSPVIELLSDDLSPVRKFVTQLIGQLGLKHLELLPEIIPALIDVLKDDVPAVARQAITCGIDIFRCSLVKVALQGMFSSKFSESLKSSWECMLKFRDEIYSMAFKVGNDGRRLPALKFVESVVLLYTPDPNGSSEPPSDQITEGNFEEFNVSWLRGVHPILNVGDLSVEATRNLGQLLDQLRSPSLKSHSSLMIIVLIKSLSAVARKRPSFYGRILPVLLALDPPRLAGEGTHVAGVQLALKNAFEACLDCSHPSAAPWRDRLHSALTEIKVGKPSVAAKQIYEDNGRAEQSDNFLVAQIHEDEKSPIALDNKHIASGRKRTGALGMADLAEDESPGKRARSTPDAAEGSGHDRSGKMGRASFSEPIPSRSEEDRGPVQQLVAMFGALVAQGDKAAASLEILIASISADLLAEVVIANMRNLPPDFPLEGDEEPPLNMGAFPGMIGSDTHLRHLSLLLKDLLSQSKSSPQKEFGIEEPGHMVSSEFEQTQEDGLQVISGDGSIPYDGSDHASQPASVSMKESVSAEGMPSMMETDYTANTSEVNDIEVVENEIPGLALSSQDDILHETEPVFPKVTTDLDDSNQDSVSNLGRTPLELAQSLSTERSEELSPGAAVTDATSTISSTATSVRLMPQLPLPKISAPVICLADEQKDQLQEMAFVRIIDAYRQVTVAGGSQVRFSILAHSGIEFPSELDPWKFLKSHIFSDYVNNEGHELTLQVLNRLFGEAEEDRDFFSSTTATSVFETFLLQVAETLRDSFPATDKSLSRLLGEAPYLPKSLLEMLERMCSPGTSDNDEKELHGGDRVTQGLSTVWSLILLRPPIRDACLKIALKSAVHHLEEVRMKAIRLVANKLYPLSSISGKIEDFAKETLLSVARDDQTTSTKEGDVTFAESPKDENPSNENQSANLETKDISSGAHHSSASENTPSSNVAEVQRCMSLYFALCTKKHSLLRQIFDVYRGIPDIGKQAVHGQIPLLVRTIGASRGLLDILSNPPTGSEGLVTQVVHTLTDGTVPSPELISTVKRLYDTKLKDVDILIPILPFLPVDEVLLLFPHLVNTPLDKFQAALSRVLQGINHSTPVLTPAEALIAIHGIDPGRDGIPLKKVTDACNACFEQREIFSQQVLAKVLNQLVEQTPLPFLFMRTVLQALGAFPSLVGFIMEILGRLVSKQIWKNPKLWVGFMKCALLTKPQSFSVLLQLPTAQLENALNRTPALKAPLIAHASQPQIRSSLPRSTLVVLGIVSDAQTSNQTPPTQTQTVIVSDAQASNQTPPTQTQTVIVSDAQASNQTPPTQTQTVIVSDAQASNQTPPTKTQTQTPPAETQTGETGLSEKEDSPDKSKESSNAS